MADMSFQATIPASGKVQLSSALPSSIQPDILIQSLIIQNNCSHIMRYGDVTVSATAPAAVSGGQAGRGIIIFPSAGAGAQVGGGIPAFINYTSMLSDWWVAGTAGDVVDFLFVR
jgi:hypothetical protein